uniref:UDP-N-acetylenolpyruvoylglucosamine reductase n=1 Tax=Desulfobacca acetoxidans TaxID=60893 RepID=A0A7V4G7H5_9BACT
MAPHPHLITLPGLRGPVYAGHPLAPLTTWRIGGPAARLAVPQDLEDVYALLRLAAARDWPVFFLGRGSNVLIADAGLPGLTLYLAKSFQKIELLGNLLKVGAGVALPRLARVLASWGIAGYEFLAGIPGTVGAGVRLNAGAHGENLGQRLHRVWVVTPGLELAALPAAELALGYRTSRLLTLPRHLVVEVELVVTAEASPESIRARQDELLRERRGRQPADPRTCGSVFKNPPSGPPAGWLIEQTGWKGRRYGGAQVSFKHANFIINKGGATAADIRRLMADITASVLDTFGIRLTREVVFLPEDVLASDSPDFRGP